MRISEKILEDWTRRIMKRAEGVSSIQGPDPSLEAGFQKDLLQIADLRGRAPVYPYISSSVGQGPFVRLKDGSVKLDLISGIGVHILGRYHPEIIKASLKAAFEDQVMQGHLQMSGIYRECLETLVSLAKKNSNLRHGWICPSGSMANENALKAIRQKHKGRRKILAFEGAFAGRTSLMAEITHNPKIKEGLPSYNEVLRVPFCPADPERALAALKAHWKRQRSEIACFMVEFMQGDGGCRTAHREFFLPLFEFCKKKGIAVWADEVQTFCRSGEFFAFEKLRLGAFMDVVTVGKAFQMSASLWTKEYNPRPGLVAGTFAGSSSAFYAGKAVLDVLASERYMGEGGRIATIFQNWKQRLKELEKEGLVSDIDGFGLMSGVTPLKGQKETTARLLKKMFQKGLIAYTCGRGGVSRLRFLMPAVVKDRHLAAAAAVLKESLLEVQSEL